MRFTYKYRYGYVTITEEKKEENCIYYICESDRAKFLKQLVDYANFGADMEASVEQELDTSDINNFIE